MSSRTSYRSRRHFFKNVISHLLRRSSFPHATRFAGLARGPRFIRPSKSLFIACSHVVVDFVSFAMTFFQKVIAHSLRRSSFPNRTRSAAVGGFATLRMRPAPCGYFAGLRFGWHKLGTHVDTGESIAVVFDGYAFFCFLRSAR